MVMTRITANIFISYARKDEPFACRLAALLDQAGAQVWLDVEDIPAGVKWSAAIQRGLDESQLLLVVVTPTSIGSVNVEDEWQYFLDKKKPVIPLLLESAELPFQLNRLQWIDFSKNSFENAFDRLLKEIEAKGFHLGSTTPIATLSAQAPQPASTPSRPVMTTGSQRYFIVIGVVAVLIVATLILPRLGGQANTIVTQTPTPTSPQHTNTPDTLPTNTVMATVPSGETIESVDLTLQWSQDHLTLVFNGPTGLADILVSTVNGEYRLTQLFPAFASQGNIIRDEGTCLRLIRENAAPVLPLACSGDVYEAVLPGADVFWYDQRSNRLLDLVVRRGADDLAVCSAAEQTCSIEVSA
jgi:hypothetical protein